MVEIEKNKSKIPNMCKSFFKREIICIAVNDKLYKHNAQQKTCWHLYLKSFYCSFLFYPLWMLALSPAFYQFTTFLPLQCASFFDPASDPSFLHSNGSQVWSSVPTLMCIWFPVLACFHRFPQVLYFSILHLKLGLLQICFRCFLEVS